MRGDARVLDNGDKSRFSTTFLIRSPLCKEEAQLTPLGGLGGVAVHGNAKNRGSGCLLESKLAVLT